VDPLGYEIVAIPASAKLLLYLHLQNSRKFISRTHDEWDANGLMVCVAVRE
jgi:hypothetical protein